MPRLTDEQILDTPVSELNLEIRGVLYKCIETVSKELGSKNVAFQPNFYLGDEDFWATDRGISINIPWYLANSRLWKIASKNQLLQFSPTEVKEYLRHEIGHTVCYAYELWDTHEWTKLFGDFHQQYKDRYRFDPNSKEFVSYISTVLPFYAQKHPDEDFAETFACWLDPKSNWKVHYKNRPVVLEKLYYIESLNLSTTPNNTWKGRPSPYTSLGGTVRKRFGFL